MENTKEIAATEKATEVAQQQYQKEINAQTAQTEQEYDLNRFRAQKAVNEAKAASNQADYEATVVKKQEADAKAIRIKADADKYQVEQQAAANAKQISQEGAAKAEAQMKLAEAFKENANQVLTKAVIDALPVLAQQFAGAVGNIDNLTVFDGADGVTRQANASLAQTLSFVKQATGVDVANVINQQAKGTRTIEGAVPVQVEHE